MSKPTYEYLEAQVKQLEADNEKAMSVLKEANDAVLLAKSKFDALAAENAGLISSSECLLHEASEVYRAYNKTQLPDGDLVDEQCLQEVYDAINATPTTDAFLAEVRAQAVELCADSLLSNDDIGVDGEYQLMREFAAKLRQGDAL